MSDEHIDSEQKTDRQTVADYLTSDRFREIASHQTSRVGLNGSVRRTLSYWVETGPTSLLLGIGGLAVILGLAAIWFPLMAKIAEEFDLTASYEYWRLMLIIQPIVLPPIFCFGFATITPMLWYGSVVLRFAMGAAICIPGCVVFLLGMAMLDGGSPPDDFVSAFILAMLTYFLTAGFIAVAIQLWTPWTLSHRRDIDSPLPPTGMASLLELTVIAAISFVLFSMFRGEDWLEALVFFSIAGVLAAVITIPLLMTMLNDAKRKHRGYWIATGIGMWGLATLVCGFFAFMEYGMQGLMNEWMFILFCALWGAIWIAGVSFVCIRWLIFCEWLCVNRKELRAEIKAMA